MIIWKIIFKQGEDAFDINILTEEKKLVVDTSDLAGANSLVSSNVFSNLREHQLSTSLNVRDLLHLALGVYTTDQIVSRESYGFQGWSRHFKLYVPVSNLDDWLLCQEKLEKLLSFLSGDKWEIVFRQKVGEQEIINFPATKNPKGIQTVALFSGGLDSFVEAINLLEDKRNVAFVSHYKRGSESSVQTKLYRELIEGYGEDSFISHQIYVQPNQRHKDTSKEGSSRARSFLFMCLGVSIANALGDDVDFIIPENGLISLNIPLTGTRLSSHSTRTTHPYYLMLFKEVVSELGIGNSISNPHQYKTKGEMMEECENQNLLRKLSPETISCSHSEHSRYAGLSPGIQCGYCVPCLIRQSAEKKSRIGGTEYVHSVLKSPPVQTSQAGSDTRAFKLAITKMSEKTDLTIMFDILSSGPIEFEDFEELNKFVDVYKRGMKEVKDFLNY